MSRVCNIRKVHRDFRGKPHAGLVLGEREMTASIRFVMGAGSELSAMPKI